MKHLNMGSTSVSMENHPGSEVKVEWDFSGEVLHNFCFSS